MKIRGQWRHPWRAIDKHGYVVDFLPSAKRHAYATKRFLRKMLQDEPLLSPTSIGTDCDGTSSCRDPVAVEDRLLPPGPMHHVTKHLRAKGSKATISASRRRCR